MEPKVHGRVMLLSVVTVTTGITVPKITPAMAVVPFRYGVDALAQQFR